MHVRIKSTTDPSEVLTSRQPIQAGADIRRIIVACTTIAPADYERMRAEKTPKGWKVYISDESGAEAHRFTVTHI